MPSPDAFRYLPPRSPSAENFQLILLHGFGANEEDLLSLAEFLPDNLAITALRAPIKLGFGGYAWYPLHQDQSGLHVIPEEEQLGADYAKRVIDEVLNLRNANSAQTFLMGFSQGAIMSLATALNSTTPFLGTAALSGRWPTTVAKEGSSEVSPGHFFLGHGTQDQVLPFQGSLEAESLLKQRGMTVEMHPYDAPHTITMEELGHLKAWMEVRMADFRSNDR